MEKIKYLQFPVMMVRNINKEPEKCTQDILGFALVDFALKQEIPESDAARQAIYNYYRGGGLSELHDTIDRYAQNNQITLDEDSCGFDGNGFNPEGEITDLFDLFAKDSKLKELAILNAQLSTIDDFFDVTGPGPDALLKKYQELKSTIDQHEAEHGKEPRPTIARDLFFDLVKEPELFSGYVAIRSIEGQKNFAATNRPTIAGRMAGYKSAKLLPPKNEVFDKYNNSRYYFDKLIEELIGRSLIKSILRQKHWRQFFISTKLTPEQLGEAVAKKRIKNDIKKLNDEAKKKYLQLYNGATL
jgi:hypothetical protein